MAYFGLADSMDAPKPLFNPVGVPGQVIVDHQVGTLQVDTFTSCIGGDQDLHFGVVLERFLRLHAVFATHSAVDKNHSVSADRARSTRDLRDS